MGHLYPIFANVTGRKVVVVGGGVVAHRKVLVLLESGAKVSLVGPELTEELARLQKDGMIEVFAREYQNGDLEGAWFVIAATDCDQVNRQDFAEAEKLRIFCNVVDEPELCSFQVPSVVNRGDLQIAISTRGASPALAKHLRRQLQEEFGEYYKLFLDSLRQLRKHLKNKYPDDQPRRAEILEGFVNSEALDFLRHGKSNDFQQLLNDWKNR